MSIKLPEFLFEDNSCWLHNDSDIIIVKTIIEKDMSGAPPEINLILIFQPLAKLDVETLDGTTTYKDLPKIIDNKYRLVFIGIKEDENIFPIYDQDGHWRFSFRKKTEKSDYTYIMSHKYYDDYDDDYCDYRTPTDDIPNSFKNFSNACIEENIKTFYNVSSFIKWINKKIVENDLRILANTIQYINYSKYGEFFNTIKQKCEQKIKEVEEKNDPT